MLIFTFLGPVSFLSDIFSHVLGICYMRYTTDVNPEVTTHPPFLVLYMKG